MKSIQPLSLAAAAALLLVPLAAQGKNMRLLSTRDKFPGAVAPNNNYAGIWGMVVNGREIAIVPARTGTIIYDCTDPKNPIEKGFIPGPAPGPSGYFWREAQSYGNYAYVCSEHGACQVINLSNPDSPVLAGSFGSSMHTVSIDQGTGMLWGNGGAGRGCRIYNLKTNPVTPPLVTSFSSPYVHDSLPIRGYVYLAQIFDGNMRIVDTSKLPTLTTVSTTTTPGQFTHNVWVTDDDKLAITADENQGGCLTVYDISNKASPQQRATWCSPNGATVHNVFIKGKVAHFSSYSDGYWAVDLSNPTAPAAIGQYDTSPLSGSNYHGCWGCYPFQPSGVIYLSDMQKGFFIVEPECGVPLLYGAGTAGTGGLVPTIDYSGGFAKVGNGTYAITNTNVKASAPVALIVGVASANVPVLGINLLVDIVQPTLVFSGNANAQGIANFPIAIPPNASWAGVTYYAQSIVLDSGGPQNLAATRGMRTTICP
jgi:choice-of-anchor B domain-containing protein